MKVLASDFDNTLFFHDQLKQEDIDAIKAFQQQGGLFGICTGRPFYGVEEPTKGRIHYDFYILISGAMILNDKHEVIREYSLNKEAVDLICRTYQDNCNIALMIGDVFYALNHQNPLIHMEQKIVHSVYDRAEPAYAISIEAHTTKRAHEIAKALSDLCGEHVDAFVNGIFVDVVAKGCSKGQAITLMKDYLKTDFIAGIGDNYNDLPMFSHCDYAFTFHDSPEGVKKHADRTVSGVAEAIRLLERLP